MFTIVHQTPEQEAETKRWSDAGMVYVTRPFTATTSKNKLHYVSAGKFSIKFELCDFYFMDDDGEICRCNMALCMANPDYFKLITPKELRRMKLEKISQTV